MIPVLMHNFPAPNIVDIAALVIIIIGAALGFKRGLSGELARFLSVIAAFVFGLWFCAPFGEWLTNNSRLENRAAYAFAFLVTILMSFTILLALRFLLKRVIKVVVADSFDRIGGAVAGFASSFLFVVIVLLSINLWPHEYLNRIFGKESILGRAVLHVVPTIRHELEAAQLPVSELENKK